MKLHASRGYALARSYDIASALIHKQQNRRDKRWQAARQLGGAFQRNGAWAGGVQHKTDSVGASVDGLVHILLAGQSADFDSRSGHGSQSKATVRLGKPQCASYIGPRK